MAQNGPEDQPAQLIRRTLTIIVVARNDAEGLAATVERLRRAVMVTTEDFEILIFDDGSSDRTAIVASELTDQFSAVRLIRHKTPMGSGRCFAEGAQQARLNFVVYVPADNTWPYRSYVELFGNIGKADVIVSYSSNFPITMPLTRRFVSRAYTGILNTVFRCGLHYYNGLAVYPTEFVRSSKINARGFGFQAEMLIRAISSGYSFLEVLLPIDPASAVRSRPLTPGNIIDALTMIGRLGVQFNFAPSAFRGQRVVHNFVKGGSPFDELGLSAPEAFRENPRPQQALRVAITGASSGIGAALAHALGGDGHRVFICARRKERLTEIARQVPSARPVVCDVTNDAEVAGFASAISAEVGALDVLINCVGAFGEIGLVSETDSAAWWQTLQLNVLGPYLTIKHCLPLLEKGRKPRIINMSGGGAFEPFAHYSAYACSKAALVRLTECLALELHPRNIRVNAISPGAAATDIHKATVEAGPQRAGEVQYQRALSLMADDQASLDRVIVCVRAMLSSSFDRLTGKTISCNFDPWQTEAFLANIDNITMSDLYTLRRMNVFNLNEGYLRKTLLQAWADFGSRS